ncbi:MAG TPA: TonB-dependent receptor [Sphingobium sp.]
MKKYKIKLMASSIAGLLAQSSIAAVAQDATPQQPETTGSTEIIVTAQRRSERLLDVPASITALSAETLEKSGITSTSDLARAVPGVAMTFYGAFLQPAIRGVTSTGANLGENSNVAMYIDGVYQPQQIATLIDLPDVQQVEVLKGPQGALYGQNATGGAILITSRAPSFTPTGMLSASYGNYDAVSLRGFVSGPITDKIAASIAGAYQDRDGFRRHVVTGERDRGLTAKVVRGKLLFQPSDDAKITLTGYYSDRNDSAMYAGFAINGNSIGYAPDLSGFGIQLPVPVTPKATSPKQFSTDPDVFTRIKSWGGNIRGEFDTGVGTINSTTAYFRNSTRYLNDSDFTAVNIGQSTADPLKAHYFIQDLNFASEKFGAVSFLAGVFYLNGSEEFVNNNFDLLFPNVPPAAKIRLGGTNQNAEVKKEIIAGYGEVTLEAMEHLFLTAGARYTHEQQRTFSDYAIFTPGGAPTKVPEQLPYPDNPVTFSKLTPRITARYELTPSSNVYASWGRGFKSGVVNTTNFTVAPVKPEVVDAYEVGFKGRLVNSLSLSVAAFLYDYKDLQSVIFVPGQAYITQNAATARIKGVDVDLSWQVMPGLTLSSSASFLDAKYREFLGAANYIPTGTGHTPSTIDLSGHRMLRAPKFSGNIAANYEVETSAGQLSLFGSVYHSSSYGMEPTGRIRQGRYTTVDGEIGLRPEGIDNLRLVVWGKNLTNKAYLASALVAGTFADGGSYAEPRTYGVRAEYRF